MECRTKWIGLQHSWLTSVTTPSMLLCCFKVNIGFNEAKLTCLLTGQYVVMVVWSTTSQSDLISRTTKQLFTHAVSRKIVHKDQRKAWLGFHGSKILFVHFFRCYIQNPHIPIDFTNMNCITVLTRCSVCRMIERLYVDRLMPLFTAYLHILITYSSPWFHLPRSVRDSSTIHLLLVAATLWDPTNAFKSFETSTVILKRPHSKSTLFSI
jgi:hypothetical protein